MANKLNSKIESCSVDAHREFARNRVEVCGRVWQRAARGDAPERAAHTSCIPEWWINFARAILYLQRAASLSLSVDYKGRICCYAHTESALYIGMLSAGRHRFTFDTHSPHTWQHPRSDSAAAAAAFRQKGRVGCWGAPHYLVCESAAKNSLTSQRRNMPAPLANPNMPFSAWRRRFDADFNQNSSARHRGPSVSHYAARIKRTRTHWATQAKIINWPDSFMRRLVNLIFNTKSRTLKIKCADRRRSLAH